VVPDFYGCSVGKLLYITIQVPKILKWLLDFCKISVPVLPWIKFSRLSVLSSETEHSLFYHQNNYNFGSKKTCYTVVFPYYAFSTKLVPLLINFQKEDDAQLHICAQGWMDKLK
jgi:hypothetical protein